MLSMIGTIYSVRHGSMQDESGRTNKWAKVLSISETPENVEGFKGLRHVEFGVPAEYVDALVADTNKIQDFPCTCDMSVIMGMSGGKAVIKIAGLKQKHANKA